MKERGQAGQRPRRRPASSEGGKHTLSLESMAVLGKPPNLISYKSAISESGHLHYWDIQFSSYDGNENFHELRSLVSAQRKVSACPTPRPALIFTDFRSLEPSELDNFPLFLLPFLPPGVR